MKPIKISRRTVDAAEPGSAEYVLWDSEVPGFGLRVYLGPAWRPVRWLSLTAQTRLIAAIAADVARQSGSPPNWKLTPDKSVPTSRPAALAM